MCNHNKDEQVSEGGEKTGTEKGQDIFDPSAPPVFIELLLRMIEQLSDDIVSWSIAGDSFIIKQASEKRRPEHFSGQDGRLEQEISCRKVVLTF